MPTTLLATALPHSLADDAPFHLTVFVTHKLVAGPGEPAAPTLADFPPAADWVGTLAGCTLTLRTSLGAALPLRVVSAPDAGAWSAALPPGTRVAAFPAPAVSDAPWRTLPASRMSDHAVDLHLAAVTAAPTRRPGLAGDPVAEGLLETLAGLDRRGPLRQLLDDAPARARRALQLPARRLQEALTTVGPLTEPDPTEREPRRGRELPPLPPYQSEIADQPSPVEVLLDDPDADRRVTERLDAVAAQGPAEDPQLRLLADAHAVRRYYERPELPQPEPRAEPDPAATPPPRPTPPEPDVHARVAGFGATPALLRRLGLAVDVVVDGVDAAGARAALDGAAWVSVGITPPDGVALEVLPPRRTAVVVEGAVFAARSSADWVGGALPLGDDDWVVLDTDPDASGLKLDQYVRDLARQYASEANGDPATSAPGTLRVTGFALARRERAAQVRERVRRAEQLAADDGTRELLLDDLVRGVRVEVWDDVTREWHGLHRRRVSATGPDGTVLLEDEPDAGFLQLSALNRPPGDPGGYYLHEVVAGWDGWSLSAPRPGRVVVHVEPPGPDGATEAVLDEPPDAPADGVRVTSRVEPGSLPRLRYGTSYSFRVLAVDLAGNAVPQVASARRPVLPLADGPDVDAARAHLGRLRAAAERRDAAGVAVARRDAALPPLRGAGRRGARVRLPDELLSGEPLVDAALRDLVARAAASAPATSAAQRLLDDVAAAARVLAGARGTLRVRPQLRTDPALLAALARNDDLLLPAAARLPARPVVTAPRPYLRWDPVPAPALVPRHPLGTGEQPAHLVVRSGTRGDGDARATAERHLAAPKATQLEAETAGRFDAAIGTGDAAEVRRLYAVALAERGTLLDQAAPSLTDPRATDPQPGIALADRPGADTDPARRATLEDVAADRGRPLGEGQYVVHDTDALRLPYLPDPYASGVSLVFYGAGAPHGLPEPEALQAVAVTYPGSWPSVQPLRLVLERGDALDARVEGHTVRVALPPGEQVRVAVSSTVDVRALEHFGLWRSHLASAADPADGFTADEVVAAAALMRAASSGWTWWLTPSVDVRLVHAVPVPVRPPELRGLSVFLRPPGRSVVALTGLVDVHGSSTDTLVVRATWTETVDDPAAPGPQQVTRSDVVVRSAVGERERTGVLFLYDLQPSGALASALGGIGFHRALQTFEDTHHRRVTYVPSGTTRYAEYFQTADVPAEPPAGEPVVLDIPSSARPAAPTVLDTVPLLRWSAGPEPDDPFAWRQVRRSGVRVWLARPWFSSGDGELLGVLVFDPDEWVRGDDDTWVRRPKALQAPDGATSLWAADPVVQDGGPASGATVPPLLALDQLVLDLVETAAAEGAGIRPPLGGEPPGGSERGWPDEPGSPVAVAASVPLRDVVEHPAVRVLGYRPEYDAASGRWFADVALHETPALWPFVRLAVARYQPDAIDGCTLSPVALTAWAQPLPSRALTVGRPDAAHVQVTLTGVVSWLRPPEEPVPGIPGEQLSADTPTGEAAERAARLQASRTVRATVQHRPEGAGDLGWEMVSTSLLLAVSVEDSGGFRATWTGSVVLPAGGDDAPGLRRPGVPGSRWRVLVEEHELLDADPLPGGADPTRVPRLVHADVVEL
ncbi:hypothetical protein [Cellulomonas endometrii]|uniref:hypothetical protein n=1 Tax=Cellulomonas endometrii TaxID=3036301 RepID=UPI0024ADFD09|nr:hypothetical protein [Cellulomonas endometrii]